MAKKVTIYVTAHEGGGYELVTPGRTAKVDSLAGVLGLAAGYASHAAQEAGDDTIPELILSGEVLTDLAAAAPLWALA